MPSHTCHTKVARLTRLLISQAKVVSLVEQRCSVCIVYRTRTGLVLMKKRL